MNGFFITFEGGEGSGKTTVTHLLYEKLEANGFDCVLTREPGGVAISENIRNLILSEQSQSMDGRTEALLYAAARREHLVQKIIPSIQKGKIVLCDRFIDSSLAYQGYARRLGIEEVLKINEFALENMMPNLTLLFDLPPELGLRRIHNNKNREINRLDEEDLQFHESVYTGYQKVYKRFSNRFCKIDATLPLEEVVDQSLNIILQHIHRIK